MVQLTDEEKEMLQLLADLDYEASSEHKTVRSLCLKGLLYITASDRLLITEAGIDFLDDNGWSIR